jgi:4-hydroxy-tetrahydrodipicolinate reductase
MEVVISGYGKMGKEVESVLHERGISPLVKTEDVLSVDPGIASRSICIDFTEPNSFMANYKFIAENFKAAVVGTTGWNNIREDVVSCFIKNNTPMIYASNFSTGVNLLFKLCEIAARLTSEFEDYDPYILEMHHKFKLDAPSGTAKTIGTILEKNGRRSPAIQSVRAGFIPGIHEIGFESSTDRIKIVHEAFSRKGFAKGALLAAEWTETCNGVYEFREILEENFNKIIGIC